MVEHKPCREARTGTNLGWIDKVCGKTTKSSSDNTLIGHGQHSSVRVLVLRRGLKRVARGIVQTPQRVLDVNKWTRLNGCKWLAPFLNSCSSVLKHSFNLLLLPCTNFNSNMLPGYYNINNSTALNDKGGLTFAYSVIIDVYIFIWWMSLHLI